MSQNHFTLSLPLKAPADAKALADLLHQKAGSSNVPHGTKVQYPSLADSIRNTKKRVGSLDWQRLTKEITL